MTTTMRDRIDIYWFSGTGNTLAVAREMANVFEQAGKTVELIAMEEGPPAEISQGTTIGLAVPVACGNTYDLCWEFILNLPAGEGAGCFFVDTLGKHSGGIVGPVRDIVTAKGYATLGAREIRMASNFITTPKSPEKIEHINKAGLIETRAFANELLDGEGSWRRNSLFQRLAKRIARSRGCWRVTRWLAKIRIDAAACTGCGLCAKICPADAMTMIDAPGEQGTDSADAPRKIAAYTKKRCQVCLRCAAHCPVKAISVRTVKTPYLNPTATLGKGAGGAL